MDGAKGKTRYQEGDIINVRAWWRNNEQPTLCDVIRDFDVGKKRILEVQPHGCKGAHLRWITPDLIIEDASLKL